MTETPAEPLSAVMHAAITERLDQLSGSDGDMCSQDWTQEDSDYVTVRVLVTRESAGAGLDVELMAEAIHRSNEHRDWSGCIDMDRQAATDLLTEYARLEAARDMERQRVEQAFIDGSVEGSPIDRDGRGAEVMRNENPISVDVWWTPDCGYQHFETNPLTIPAHCPDGVEPDPPPGRGAEA